MARTRTEDPAGCPVGEVLRLFGRPYVLTILNSFYTAPGPHRFVALQRKLGISPNTLTQRLHELVKAGLLYRVPYNEIPPRVDYELTEKARELIGIFDEIAKWAQRNDLHPAPERSRAAVSAPAGT